MIVLATQLIVWIVSVGELLFLIYLFRNLLKLSCMRFYSYLFGVYSAWIFFQFLVHLTHDLIYFYISAIIGYALITLIIFFSSYLHSEEIFTSTTMLGLIFFSVLSSYLLFGIRNRIAITSLPTGDILFRINVLPYKIIETTFFLYGTLYFLYIVHYYQRNTTEEKKKKFSQRTFFVTGFLVLGTGVLLFLRGLTSSAELILIITIFFYVVPQLYLSYLFYLSRRYKMIFCAYLFDIFQLIVYDKGGMPIFSYDFARHTKHNSTIISSVLSAINTAMAQVVETKKLSHYQKIFSGDRTILLIYDDETKLYFAMILSKLTNLAEERFKYFVRQYKNRYKQITLMHKDTLDLTQEQRIKLKESVDIVHKAFPYYASSMF